MDANAAGKMKDGLLGVISALQDGESILPHLNERTYSKRHILFMPHHNDNLLFIVKKGRLRVYLSLHGRELSLAILGPGDVYCTHTRAYVEALEDTSILTCSTETVIGLASQHQPIIGAVVGSLGGLMTNAITIIENLYFNCADKRVASFFYEQAMNHGKQMADGIYLKVGLTVEHISKVVGTCRQTVSSFISLMERNDIMTKVARGEFIIRDIDKLYSFVNACSD